MIGDPADFPKLPATGTHHPHSPRHSSDSNSDSDSESSSSQHGHADFSSSIFRSNLNPSNSLHNHSHQDLAKIQSFLTSSSSGALSCLICLERIKPSDPSWSCSSRCFTPFHLLCIHSWAHQSTSLAYSRSASRAAVVPDDNSLVWPCPKCRVEYPKSQTPKNYYCFCGKLQDPVCDPWILPHSCGEVCGRALKNDCGHHCLLLCHPGPCPTCPKSVRNKCFCGELEDVRRCAFKNFSCNGVCGKVLECGVHRCGEICHDGSCPPCKKKGAYRCLCGKVELERECCEREFRCENACNKMLGCTRHVCERGCHEGECKDCPLQGKRTCPCGKKVYEGMPCDSTVPLCGGTCHKTLSCRFHKCPERCHRGPCIETCRTVVTKSCLCGSLKKQVPCYQELTCDRKCQKMRDCGRHACKRRCCDGDCPPCSEVCDRRLRCRNHKCPAPCHRGACAPCPLMVRISCSCAETHFEVPCGTEVEQKPPKCPKPCRINPLCEHGPNCKPHRCHFGACPPCRLICDKEYPCGHKCKLRCHGPKPPPVPEFTLKPKKKKLYHQRELTPGSPCPPCTEHEMLSLERGERSSSCRGREGKCDNNILAQFENRKLIVKNIAFDKGKEKVEMDNIFKDHPLYKKFIEFITQKEKIPSYSKIISEEYDDSLSYEKSNHTNVIFIIENFDLKWKNDPWFLMNKYLGTASYAVTSYKQRDTYENILIATQSCEILHFTPIGVKNIYNFSKIIIKKIISLEEWGISSLRENEFFHPELRLFIKYNYWDYIKAFKKVFLYENNNHKHSWFIKLCFNNFERDIPNWFRHWWISYGPSIKILPQKWQELYFEWVNVSPKINMGDEIYIEGMTSLNFFCEFSIPWIWKWAPEIGYTNLNIPCMKRNFYTKFWQKMLQKNQKTGQIYGHETIDSIKKAIVRYREHAMKAKEDKSSPFEKIARKIKAKEGILSKEEILRTYLQEIQHDLIKSLKNSKLSNSKRSDKLMKGSTSNPYACLGGVVQDPEDEDDQFSPDKIREIFKDLEKLTVKYTKVKR